MDSQGLADAEVEHDFFAAAGDGIGSNIAVESFDLVFLGGLAADVVESLIWCRGLKMEGGAFEGIDYGQEHEGKFVPLLPGLHGCS